MPINELGYTRRTYDDILNDKIQKAKELFGEDIETSELTPFGKFLRINAYDQSLVEEEAETIYYSIFPNTATGTALDRLCVFAGITRNPATYARYSVTVAGTAGETIPLGFLVGTENGINYYNTADTVIDVNGSAVLTVDCVQSGEIGNVATNDITQIVNPSANVDSITSASIVVQGEEIESDYELRTRFNSAKEGLGSSNEVAIKAAVLRVPTVTSVGIVVNETDTTDEDNRPPRSFECYVTGGNDYHTQIAETIFDKKPIGIKTHGDISQEISDSGGHNHTIKFSHTTNVSIYIRIAILTDNTFGENGKNDIKENLQSYINSIGVGNSVILSSLYGKIHSVTGVKEVTVLQLSNDGTTWVSDNIDVETYENCVFTQLAIKKDSEVDYEVV